MFPRTKMTRIPVLKSAAVLSVLMAASFFASAQTLQLLPDPVASQHRAERLDASYGAPNAATPGIRDFGPVKSIQSGSYSPSYAYGASEFVVRSGELLRAVIHRWAHQSGWEVSWELPNDFSIGASASFSGDFEDVIDALVGSIGGQVANLQVELYTVNRVVRVSDKNRGRKE